MEVKRVELPAAKAGTLTTRTDNTTGTITGASGHGIVTADRIDLYWPGGQRRNVLVGTVAGTSIPFSGGTGDNLPAASTAVTFVKPQAEPLLIDGSSVVAILIHSAQRATVSLKLSDLTTEAYGRVVQAGIPWTFVKGYGDVNPIDTLAVASASLSQDSITANQTVTVVILFN
jgi:hypothetical protein